MGAITTAAIAIAGIVLGWITIEIACKPCLDKGRDAMDRSLNPDYDPDDDDLRAPLDPASVVVADAEQGKADESSSASSGEVKTVE